MTDHEFAAVLLNDLQMNRECHTQQEISSSI